MESAGVIRPLPPEVIKRIAAGEIIVRPSSAIKELIENSIDAGATEIRINMSANPLDFCEIIDNGCGVSEKDLLIICRRYTTSKTRDSIDGVKSLGFRGEALSSLSQSAHVTISSRTENETRRTVVRYSECEPLFDEVTYEDGPRGFHLKYENLFYNYETRHKSLLANANFEFNACLQLIQKYSINFPNIKFVFNKINSNVMQLNTVSSTKTNTQQNTQSNQTERIPNKEDGSPGLAEAHSEIKESNESSDEHEYKVDNDYYFFSKLYQNTNGIINDPLVQEYIENVDRNSMSNLELVKETIKNIYGLNVSRILHQIVFNNFDELFFNCKGLISHPNQPSKVDLFILYVNNRLIDLPQLKNLVYNTYNEISNNKYRRFIYLSIFVPYDRIDANIHPSKRKIMMEGQSEIVLQIINNLTNKLNDLMKVTNPVATACTNTNKLVTDYHFTKEHLGGRFKSRINAKQTNISHFVTPLFTSTTSTSAPTFTYFGSVKQEEGTHQCSNNESQVDPETTLTVTSALSIVNNNGTNTSPFATLTTSNMLSTLTANRTDDIPSKNSNDGSVQTGMNMDIESYKRDEDSDQSQVNTQQGKYIITNYTVDNFLAGNREDQQKGSEYRAVEASEEIGRILEADEPAQRNENSEPERVVAANDGSKEDDEEELFKDKNIIEKYDFNVLKIKYMNKINSFSYSKISNSKTLGSLYGLKEVQKLIDKIIQGKDEELTRIVLDSSYVGMVGKTYILVHYKTDLMMLNIFSISKECCYQSIIWRLNNIPSFRLSIEVPLIKLLTHSLTKYCSNIQVEKLINLNYIKILNILFGFKIKDLIVYKIPDVLNGYFPGVEYLSDLFYSIFSIEYTSLTEFIVKVGKVISYHYLQPPVNIHPDNDSDSDYENFACRVLFSSCQRFNDLSIPKESVSIYIHDTTVVTICFHNYHCNSY